MFGVAEGADELLYRDGLAEGEGVALGGEAGGVDEDVGVGWRIWVFVFWRTSRRSRSRLEKKRDRRF